MHSLLYVYGREEKGYEVMRSGTLIHGLIDQLKTVGVQLPVCYAAALRGTLPKAV